MFLYVGLVVAGIIIGLIAASLIEMYTPPVTPPKIVEHRPLYNCCHHCDRLEKPWIELCHKCKGSGEHTPRMFVGDDGKIYRSIYQD